MPIANKPVIEYVLTSLRDLGVTEIGLVVGDWQGAFENVLGDGSRFGVQLTYLRQDAPRGLAHAVRIARPFLGDDDFLMHLGDNLLPDGIGPIAAEFVRLRPAAGLVVQKVADPRAFGVVELDQNGAVRQLEEKPAAPRSDLAVAGVYYFTAAVHDAVAAIAPSTRGELEITDAVQWLLGRGDVVLAREYAGFWSDVGRVADVLDCNRRILGDLSRAVHGAVDAASELIGPVVLEAGARVIGSRITGPAVIGAGSHIEGSRIGPDTAIGRDCVLTGAQITDSVVLDGARITSSAPLAGSVVGRCARVGPDDSDRTGHRLVVGDHTEIRLAAA
jgi:glucose-1-phosphate thymidylyltransferase